MTRTLRVIALAATAAMAGCASPRVRHPAPPAQRPAIGTNAPREPAPPPPFSAPIAEEPIAEPTPPLIAPVPPPQPATVLASITAQTSPQRATSIRLADEGRRLLERGEFPAALDRLESAVRIDPANPHAYYWLARLHYANGRSDLAIAFADKAAALFGRGDRAWLSQAYTFKASVCEELGRFAEARQAYDRAVAAEPGNLPARAGLARLGSLESR